MDTNRPITTISITGGTIWRVFFVALTLFTLYYLRDLVIIILTSIVIASSVEPATRFLTRYSIPRVISVLLIFVGSIAFFLAIAFVFLPPLIGELSKLGDSLPSLTQSVIELLNNNVGGLTSPDVIKTIEKELSLPGMLSAMKSAIFGFSGGIVNIAHFILTFVAKFIIIVVISFYLAVQEKGIEDFLRIITPIKSEKYILDLWRRSQAKIGLWMQGQVVLGLFIGVLVYLVLSLIGVPYSLLLAILSAVFEIIPVFGPVLAMTPGVVLAMVDGGLALGMITAGAYIIIQQFESHFLYPLVVRKVVGVPPLLVIISLLVGAELAGFLGIIIAVPIAAALVEYTKDIEREKNKRMTEMLAS